MPKKYRSKIAAAVHETASDLYEIGVIDSKTYGAVSWPRRIHFAPDATYEAICRNGEYVLD